MRWSRVLALAVLCLSACPTAPAAEEDAKKEEKKEEKKVPAKAPEKAGKGKKSEKKQGKKALTWAVVRVESELKVVKGDQIPEIRKILDTENEKAAKAAPKDKPPKPRTLEVVKEGLPSQREAEKFAARYKKEELLAKKKAVQAGKGMEKDAKKDAEPPKKIPAAEVDL